MRMQMHLTNPRYRTFFKGMESYALHSMPLKRTINRRAHVVRRAIVAKLPRVSGQLQESVYRRAVSTRHGRWGWRYAVRVGSDLPYAAAIEHGRHAFASFDGKHVFKNVAEAYNAPIHPKKL
jgi:hypothetical protein